jgi:SsrA-binding protein
MSENSKNICKNRKARYDYHILETFEAGMVLLGTEVKSLRAGKASIKDSYGSIEKGELWLRDLHITPYAQAAYDNHEPERPRKLLVTQRELKRLIVKVREKGYTLVPLSLYFKEGWVKVEMALAQGKRKYDKRHAIAKRDADRAIARARKGERE